MANEMFSSLPDVITAEQLASALQISKSGAYALLNHFDLSEYAAKFPALCQLTEDDEHGGLRFEIAKERISIRLTAPYSEERKNNTRKWAKENGLQGKYDRKKQENAETEENTGKPLRE